MVICLEWFFSLIGQSYLADLKSMVSAGLSAISCSSFDLGSAVHGNTPMRILCVDHGGGELTSVPCQQN